ncbi:MAG: two-component regulator propeller domain-containing protein, partial [Kofleriaceae bacterium]
MSRRLIMLTLALLLSVRASFADDAGRVPHGLVRFRSFGAVDGLHNLVILSIAQDAGGLLWVGTDDGIYRYDGERFAHFSVAEGLLSRNVSVVGIGPDGEVCAGSDEGVACWEGSRFARVGGLGQVAVHSMVAFRGRMWVGTAAGLYVRDPAGPLERAAGWAGVTPVKALWADAAALVVGDGGGVEIGDGKGAWSALTHVGLDGERVDALLRDGRGTLWIRTEHHVWQLLPGASHVVDVGAGLAANYDSASVPTNMVNGPHGEVWIATDVGIASREGESWRLLDRSGGLPSPGARTLFVDREGTLWVGGVKLFQARGRGLIERYDTSNGLPGDVAWSFARDRDDTLWVGTNHCLARMLDGRWQCLPGSEDRIIRSFVFPPQGGVFMGGASPDLRYTDVHGTVTSFGQRSDPRGPPLFVLALALGPDGDLWVGTKSGLFRVRGAVPGPLEHVAVPGVRADARYSSLLVVDGRLWTATEQGVVVLDHGIWRRFDTTSGFRASSMRYLVRGHDRRMCVAYTEAAGVTCFDTDGRSISDLQHIEVTGMVYFIGEDRRRQLWIGAGDGVDVVAASGREHFSERDGLAGDDAAATAFLEDHDGSIWLGSTGGISHVRAQDYDGPPRAPRTLVRGGQLGSQTIRAGALAPLRTTHDRNALTLELGADTLSDPDRVEYQVRLTPLEHDWSTTHAREVRYPSLLPGSYRFEARARIGTGPWGPVTRLEGTVEPAWWQTRWFVGLACAAILLSIATGFTWRQRALLRRKTRQLNEESNATFRALLEAVPNLISVHRDGQLVYLNRAARRLFALAGDAPLVRALEDRIQAEDRGHFDAMM